MKKEDIQKIQDELDKNFSQEDLKRMQEFTQRMSIMESVYSSDEDISVNDSKDVVCKSMYEDKEKDVPLNIIEQVYDEYFSKMISVNELLVIDGKVILNPELIPVVEHRREMLGLN